MDVHTLNTQSALSVHPRQVERIVKEVLSLEGEEADEVSIHFVSEEEICEIHADYFNDPSPTDCITFPIDNEDEGYRLLGDVFVCPEVAIEYAAAHQGDPYEETTLYLIHGILHLLGYRDSTDEEIKEMRAAETRHMTHLGNRLYFLSRNA